VLSTNISCFFLALEFKRDDTDMPATENHKLTMANCHQRRYLLHAIVDVAAQLLLHTGKLPPIETNVQSSRANYLSVSRKWY
jgi:hypothetical protein